MSQPQPAALNQPVLEGLTVFVSGLAVQAAIGIYDHEHGRTQPLIIDVELSLGARDVDRLADTYNYEAVAEAARRLVDEGHIGLVETFAERLALDLMADPRIRSARVRVAKPEALAGAEAAGCDLTFRRS